MREQADAAAAEALQEEQAAHAAASQAAALKARAREKRKQAQRDREGAEEEDREAEAEATRAKAALGRRVLASGRLLSDKAAACKKKQSAGRTARVKKRKRRETGLSKREESLEAEQTAFEAEKLAFREKQRESRVRLDRGEQARAASAAMPDAFRRHHRRQVDALEWGLDHLISAPTRPRAAAASLEAVGSGVAGDLRKIRGDRLAEGKRERERVQSRQGKAQQNERWTQGNLSNERPQRRWQKLSNKHSVAKRAEKQRKAQRSVGGWPQSKGKGKGKGKGR